MANDGWMSDLHEADAIIVSTHSQGSIVSTHLLNRLIQDIHITTAWKHDSTISFGTGAETFPSGIGMPEPISRGKRKVQRVCCMGLCGIHLGPFKGPRWMPPLRSLSSSILVQPYIQVSWPSVFDHGVMELKSAFKYFESVVEWELFEFQVCFGKSR